MTRSAITASGLRKSFGEHVVLDGVDLDVAEGTVFALLGPNGAGKTTMVQILSTLIGADAGELRVAGHDLAEDPDAVRAAIGVTGQFSAVDNLLTGEENLILMADLHHLGRADGRRRAAELLDRFGLVDAAEAPGRHLLRRHAPPARSRDDARGRPADHLPRRADDRPRPPQPPHDVGDHPRARRRRRHDLPDDAVPRRGRPPRRPDRRARPRQADRRGHRGRAQAAGPGRAHPPAVRRPGRARRGRPRARRRRPRRRGPGPHGAERRQRRVAAGRVRAPRRRVRRPSPTSRSTRPTSTTSSSPSPGAEHSTDRLRIQDSATMLRRNLRRTLRYPRRPPRPSASRSSSCCCSCSSSATRWAPA